MRVMALLMRVTALLIRVMALLIRVMALLIRDAPLLSVALLCTLLLFFRFHLYIFILRQVLLWEM